jgi:hypothetical protein
MMSALSINIMFEEQRDRGYNTLAPGHPASDGH